MQVTSMLSAGYLEPVNKISRVYSPDKVDDTDISKQQKEQEILAEEQSLKAKLGNDAQVHTVYHYSMGTDGKRYITGASVTMKGSEEDLNRVSGGITTQELQKKQDEKSKLENKNEIPTDETVSERIAKQNEKRLSNDSNDKEDSEEKAQIRELENIQREVIAHENAHQATAGELGGGISYTYTKGPDGKSYITGGEVPIRFKEGSTPEETLQNMQKVQRAASAPADPSGQDTKVAAKAAAMASKARREIAKENSENNSPKTTVLKGTPIFSNNSENSQDSQEDNNNLNGVSSVLASLKEFQLQNLLPAA